MAEEDDAGREAKRKAELACDKEAHLAQRRAKYVEEMKDPVRREQVRERLRTAHAKRAACHEFRERKSEYNREYTTRPNIKEKRKQEEQERGKREDVKAAKRKRAARRIAMPEGHDGHCECCGIIPPDMADGRRGLMQDHRYDTNVVRGFICQRCNVQVAVLDLRFTDPDRFALLMAWSNRFAPAVPTRSENPQRRRKALPHPTLFDNE